MAPSSRALLAAPLGVLLAGGIVAGLSVSAVVGGMTAGLLLAGFMLLSPALRDLNPPPLPPL